MVNSMTRADYFYRAFVTYKEELKNHRDSLLFKKAVITQRNKTDFIEVTRTKCHVLEDWIKEIEKGLVFIGKAISEDRQFIRNEGDVMPIEKIRRVSQDSITDLAKHSNYITRLPEEEDDLLVPDKLLMINRENDYHVYENRVIFATLSYLRDFVSIRLNAINDISNRYEGKLIIKREVNLGYRNVDFVLDLAETQKDDPLLLENNTNKKIIERLNEILNEIMLLLRTRLMQDVSKAPLVKRPITKTNVLRMNINFRESLALFDYISAYEGDGYTIETKTEKINPLEANHTEDYADIILLTSFLTYKFNYNLEDTLHQNFIAEEKRRQTIKDQELLDRLNAAMDRAKKSGKEINEYIYLLEEGYKVIEQRINDLRREMQTLIEKHAAEIIEINAKHAEEMTTLEQKYKAIIDEIVNDHAAEISNLKLEHERQVVKINEGHNEELKQIKTNHNLEIANIKDDYNAQISGLNIIIKDAQVETDNLVEGFKQKEAKFAEQDGKITILNAQLLAYRLVSKNAPKVSEFTKRDTFLELQAQKEVIDKFFQEAWKETKKAIRQKHLKVKPNKDQKHEKE